MRSRLLVLTALSGLGLSLGCAPGGDTGGGSGGSTSTGSGGSTPGTGGATPGSGGATPGSGGATPGSGGATPGSGGATPGSGGAAPGTGGAAPGTGGAASGTGGRMGGNSGSTGGRAGGTSGGTGGRGTGGTGTATGGTGTATGGAGGAIVVAPLDCGAKGTALENHGPPSNRLNYLIVGDGYSMSDLATGGVMDTHLAAFQKKRFSDPVGQPYGRYRNFVNICVLRLPSSPICGSSMFGCCGDDSSRLANCNTGSVTSAISANVPSSFEIDNRAVMLNGNSWWNSGGTLMMFSGGNKDAGGAALHEGGHGHNALSDEYDACEVDRVSREATYGVNVSLMNNNSGGKWEGWIGYNQTPGTGMQGFFACTGGRTWRPSSNSMMNSLFGDNPNTSFNSPSREKITMDIWRAVQQPWDSVEPPAGAVSNPTMLKVNVIDPAVINVDWTVDNGTPMTNAGPTFMVTGLASGSHTIKARAYDNATMDLVRQVPQTVFNRQFWGSGAMGHSDKTVTWTVTVP